MTNILLVIPDSFFQAQRMFISGCVFILGLIWRLNMIYA